MLILLQKRPHLLLITPPPVVRPLPVDIPQQRPNIRRPDRKQPIPTLPRKTGDPALLHPGRRPGLQLRNHLRRVARHPQPQRQVHMILHATSPETLTPKPPRRLRQIPIQPRTNLLTDTRPPILGTPNNMHQIEAKRLRHTAHPNSQNRTPPSPDRSAQ